MYCYVLWWEINHIVCYCIVSRIDNNKPCNFHYFSNLYSCNIAVMILKSAKNINCIQENIAHRLKHKSVIYYNKNSIMATIQKLIMKHGYNKSGKITAHFVLQQKNLFHLTREPISNITKFSSVPISFVTCQLCPGNSGFTWLVLPHLCFISTCSFAVTRFVKDAYRYFIRLRWSSHFTSFVNCFVIIRYLWIIEYLYTYIYLSKQHLRCT